MARPVAPDDWRPRGVEALEANADLVVRSTLNTSVIAGPGAGKTELLAQRATFLLQTGACPSPQRILAISFKRDAARLLEQRVGARCHRDQAARVDSMTFDAFAKGIVDRFGPSLPAEFRPTHDYTIVFPTRRDWGVIRDSIPDPPRQLGAVASIQALTDSLLERLMSRSPFPLPEATSSLNAWVATHLWQQLLHGGERSQVTFPMISRLARLAFEVNPLLADALRLTYSHLFMDEFQDTTGNQYALVRSMFLNQRAVITAVGDNKQQIMRWAGALTDPFTQYEQDFGACRVQLLNNYRSSPELVRIQHVIARALDGSSEQAISQTDQAVDGDVAAMWRFGDEAREAAVLAAFVQQEIATLDLHQRDFVLVVRQKAAAFLARLEGEFAARGLRLRNEDEFVGAARIQDLMVDEASTLITMVIRLATSSRGGDLWTDCTEEIARLRGLDLEEADLSKELDSFIRGFREHYPDPPGSDEDARRAVQEVLALIGRDRLLARHPSYRQGGRLDDLLESISLHLRASAEVANGAWADCLDEYDGRNSVALMTIHRSKGREYHTVVFIGLEDDAWWSFLNDTSEGIASFFVGLSRAKQRVVFTYCQGRGARQKVARLHQLLDEAGVPIREP